MTMGHPSIRGNERLRANVGLGVQWPVIIWAAHPKREPLGRSRMPTNRVWSGCATLRSLPRT